MRLLIACMYVLLATTLTGCVYSYRIEASKPTDVLAKSQLEPFWIQNGFARDFSSICDQQFLPPELSLIECWQKIWRGPFGMIDGLVEATESTEKGNLIVLIGGGRNRVKVEEIAEKLKGYLAASSPPIETVITVNRSCCDF